MDAIDERILELLTADARASFTELAGRVGLSVGRTAARVRAMEASGVIAGYTVVRGDRAPAVVGLEAFVDVSLRDPVRGEDFLAWVGRRPEVLDAAHVTGPHDYLLRVVVPDTAALDRLLRRLKSEAGVARSQTRIALRDRPAG